MGQQYHALRGPFAGTEPTQVLKIIRYTTRLLLATSLPDPKSDLAIRLKAFESSVGTSRCSSCSTWGTRSTLACASQPTLSVHTYLQTLPHEEGGVPEPACLRPLPHARCQERAGPPLAAT